MPAAPRSVVVDSGPLVALFDADDAFHARAVDFVHRSRAKLISSLAAITEVMYLLDESRTAQKNLLAWIQAGGLSLAELESGDFSRVAELMEKYADLPMDFTDAVLVALSERLGIRHIASIDRDFNIYRYQGRTKFVNVLTV